jgi:NAD(P)-dependent dehydrogenase (short-subunit alcohol dehydrogenase family)
MEIQGRVALVTGASRGIGQAIALRLAEAGANVAVGYGHDQTAGEQQDSLSSLIRSLQLRRCSLMEGCILISWSWQQGGKNRVSFARP